MQAAVNVCRSPEFKLLPDGGWRLFRCVTAGRVEVRSGDSVIAIVFPVGWETDLTSTPRALLWALPQLGPHAPASAVHDRALDMWKAGEITLKQARQVGVAMLDHLDDVGRLARWSWVLGVTFNDIFLRKVR